jgi:hypothetical protein
MDNKDIIYDYIVVGGGISGLYANYKLSNKGENGLLLEKNSNFGGRAFEMYFHGSLIKLGAGVMRENNYQILKLLKQLNIKVNIFPSFTDTHFSNIFNMGKAICKIIEKYNMHKNTKLNMKDFLLKYFGSKFTKDFILNCEYHDFIKSDVEYFIKYYNIYDMSHEKHNIYIIKWIDLINKLVKKNCLSDINVLDIHKNDNIFTVKTDGCLYSCKKIILATTLKPLVKISKNILNINYKKYIGAVPFIRIYFYFKNGYKTSLSHYTIVNNKLQKLISINDNILMVSYSDGNNALYWKKINELPKNKQISTVNKYLKELNVTGTINDIVIAFWDEGVHYFKPTSNLNKMIKTLARPARNVFVVGDMVSYKQGWVEGCIESVNRTL